MADENQAMSQFPTSFGKMLEAVPIQAEGGESGWLKVGITTEHRIRQAIQNAIEVRS